MTLARARTRTARSEVERTNHEATAPPRGGDKRWLIFTMFRHIPAGFPNFSLRTNNRTHNFLTFLSWFLNFSAKQRTNISRNNTQLLNIFLLVLKSSLPRATAYTIYLTVIVTFNSRSQILHVNMKTYMRVL